MRNVIRLGFGAIALYLVVYYSSGSGTVLREGAAGGSTLIKSFQGR